MLDGGLDAAIAWAAGADERHHLQLLWPEPLGAAVPIEIANDGVGGADQAGGTGLRGLADRVESLGGRLHVTSPPGEGPVVTAELPVPSGG